MRPWNPGQLWRGAVLKRIIFYSLAVFVGLPLAFCHVLTRTYPEPAVATPAGYADLWLAGGAGRLHLWTSQTGPDIRARSPVLIVHGLGDSSVSYLDLAERCRTSGRAVALLDLRGHGASTGRVTTLGGHESDDVRVALAGWDAVRSARAGVIVVGHSMGAVAVLRAAVDRTDLAAVIVEAPFDTYRANVARHAWLYYRVPRWCPLLPLTITFAEWWAGFDADEVDAVAAAARVRSPLLAIADGADERMPEAVVRRVYDAHPGPKELWVAPGAPHVGAVLSPQYWPRVEAFLAAHGL
jgi:uncharacterized protein